MAKEKITEIENLISGDYYFINGTKKKLYWDGYEWRKPSRTKGFVTKLDTQPKFKYAIKCSEYD